MEAQSEQAASSRRFRASCPGFQFILEFASCGVIGRVRKRRGSVFFLPRQKLAFFSQASFGLPRPDDAVLTGLYSSMNR